MSLLQALYDQSPAVVWLAAGGLLIMLELATGSARLTPVALASGVPAVMALAAAPLGLGGQVAAFTLFSVVGAALVQYGPARLSPAGAGAPAPRATASPTAKPARAPRPGKTAVPSRRRRPSARPALLNLQGAEAPTVDALTAARPLPASAEPIRPEVESPLRIDRAAAAAAPGSPSKTPRPPPRPPAPARRAGPPAATVASPADPGRARRLVGATGRTTGEFANGVGRVWLDGSEWGAELDHGEELEGDRAVEVVSVSGGVRLTVRPLPLPAEA